ncbi:putative bifunctional diguanylate cyclase/phosphodiesterase [Stakelama saccharophila]|uniref:EAL domain-containing protein n=1 Tax=Stakelama saccharophila TaxID=3075605 RepID=A0ABZ0B7E0_9SPHN|nr:EAL domain-containing protein [Stakelama sp. W311]WNO53132.1 EAL domain-containing protein [Stakelama sp. W311]
MTHRTTSPFTRTRSDFRGLIGLGDFADSAEWAPIRAAQLSAAGRLAWIVFVVNLAGVALVTMLFRHDLPAAILLPWAGLAIGLSAAIAIRRMAGRNHSRITATAARLRESALEGLLLALFWVVPALGFVPQVDPLTGQTFWLVLAVQMMTAAFALSAVPLAAIAFIGVTGAAAAASLLLSAQDVLGGTMVFVTLLSLVASLERGRMMVRLRASEIALSERDETVSLLLGEFEEAEADWLWEIDAQRRVVRAGPRLARTFGLDPAAINGTSFLALLAGPTWESGNVAAGLRDLAEKLKRRDSFRDLLLPVYAQGQEFWWEISASPRFDENGQCIGFRGVGSDVTEARRSADKINRMARYDTLTGLPNRLLINETLAAAIAESEKWGGRAGFMMIDLDRFKAVNDTLGHPVGDRLLSRVSGRLKRIVGDTGMVGRLGGDEFAVVLPDAWDSARIDQLARTIIDALSRPYEVDQHTLYIGASVGIAIGPRDGRTAEMLIRSADLALYRSKDAGGGIFHAYEPQLHAAAEERRVLEIALRSALKNDQLHLLYQPVVDAGTGALKGFEALLRWTHPEFGVISPAKFVPLAEDARLIAPIGEWVLRTACNEAAKWKDDIRVAVNVSPEQLHSPNFVNMVAQTLAQSGLSADRLELEVTESVFLREGTGTVQVLDRLIDLGVRLSLDDFGTGYSPLGNLSRTRFSTIKIDRAFVQDAARNVREAVAIVRAVVALADSLGMATTAEGVESEEEHLMIQRLGCTRAQGYFFGRPLPVEEARGLATGDRASRAA